MDSSISYQTRGGLTVHRHAEPADPVLDVATLVEALDERRGALYSSSYEYPGRYTRWDIGFVDPPLVLTTRERAFRLDALNPRGDVLLHAIAGAPPTAGPRRRRGGVERTRPGVQRPGRVGSAPGAPLRGGGAVPPALGVLVIRMLMDLFGSAEDNRLGLYGAFGYDLAFQFEPLPLRLRAARRTA